MMLVLMTISLLLIPNLLAIAPPPNGPGCPRCKKVEGEGDLEGNYYFHKENSECENGCSYKRDNEECCFCFAPGNYSVTKCDYEKSCGQCSDTLECPRNCPFCWRTPDNEFRKCYKYPESCGECSNTLECPITCPHCWRIPGSLIGKGTCYKYPDCPNDTCSNTLQCPISCPHCLRIPGNPFGEGNCYNYPGKVYVSDLKKAIKYSIMDEIAKQWNNTRPGGSTKRLTVLYNYLEVLVQHLPLRQPIKSFLLSLKEWTTRMDRKKVDELMYRKKVDELNNTYNPFEGTSGPYKGCIVYDKKHNGYSCALWTLFHSLTVHAGKENSGHYRASVANAVGGYISMFYSCSGCVENFARHANQTQFHPDTHNQTILWLWAVHNLANNEITKPKHHPQWPSPQYCPNCRKSNSNTWDHFAVLSYINNVYSMDKI